MALEDGHIARDATLDRLFKNNILLVQPRLWPCREVVVDLDCHRWAIRDTSRRGRHPAERTGSLLRGPHVRLGRRGRMRARAQHQPSEPDTSEANPGDSLAYASAIDVWKDHDRVQA